MIRKYTNKLWKMLADGRLSRGDALAMCLNYMSEADVEEMMDANELTERFDDEDED